MAPSEKGLTDIIEFQISAGKVHLSLMIDCFDGQVASWSIGTLPDAELVNAMLDAAIKTVAATDDRPVVHSDRGAHYDGLDGYLESPRRNLCARCRARDTHRAMRRVNAFSVG